MNCGFNRNITLKDHGTKCSHSSSSCPVDGMTGREPVAESIPFSTNPHIPAPDHVGTRHLQPVQLEAVALHSMTSTPSFPACHFLPWSANSLFNPIHHCSMPDRKSAFVRIFFSFFFFFFQPPDPYRKPDRPFSQHLLPLASDIFVFRPPLNRQMPTIALTGSSFSRPSLFLARMASRQDHRPKPTLTW